MKLLTGFSRTLPVIRQAEAAECGLACMAMIAVFHGHKTDLNSLRQRFSMSLKGATLRDIMGMADELGFGPRALRLEPEHLKDLKTPAILHWDLNHFVVLKAVRGRYVFIHDPALGLRKLSPEETAKHFTGVALELTPATDFKPVQESRRVKMTDLWSRMTGLKRAFVQMIILSVILQLFALASPFYLQLVVDEGVTRFDKSFLLLLALGFGFLYIINAITEVLRSWVILVLGQNLTFQMAGNVLRHLLRLPADFFEKRHVGDIISRMGSILPIQNALTQSVIAALIDSVMALATAVLMLVYSWKLALIVFISTLLYLVISLVSFPFMRRREEDEITARAKEQTHVIESIRASRAVKLFGREAQREATWRNAFSDVVNAGISTGKFDLGLAFAKRLLFGLSLVLVVYFGARLILEGEFSVGMLFAFMAHRNNFALRAEGLVTRGIEFRMLGLHLERLSDIVHTGQEEGLDAPASYDRPVKGALSLQNISFRYSPHDPFVFEHVSLDVKPGEFLAIKGPSGGGKTTLFKVMLGLLPPEQGEVHIDGLPLNSFGVRALRAHSGVVMQDDQLLSGSIADNISFFDPEIDMERVMTSAVTACIHEDIMRMPMNYSGLVGDMGTALSGGQRQRLLLARALYRQPSVLFLDEGTANLDEDSENAIADILAAMPMTRVVIAHRPALIQRAGRVFEMRDGQLTEKTPVQEKV